MALPPGGTIPFSFSLEAWIAYQQLCLQEDPLLATPFQTFPPQAYPVPAYPIPAAFPPLAAGVIPSVALPTLPTDVPTLVGRATVLHPPFPQKNLAPKQAGPARPIPRRRKEPPALPYERPPKQTSVEEEQIANTLLVLAGYSASQASAAPQAGPAVAFEPLKQWLVPKKPANRDRDHEWGHNLMDAVRSRNLTWLLKIFSSPRIHNVMPATWTTMIRETKDKAPDFHTLLTDFKKALDDYKEPKS